MIPDPGGPGRPRRYCRRSHRQRAFEARRLGKARGLADGETVVASEALAGFRDARYILRTALEDGADDLREAGDAVEVRRVYDALADAAAEMLRVSVEPIAMAEGRPGALKPSQ